jgi:hypothetical protein
LNIQFLKSEQFQVEEQARHDSDLWETPQVFALAGDEEEDLPLFTDNVSTSDWAKPEVFLEYQKDELEHLFNKAVPLSDAKKGSFVICPKTGILCLVEEAPQPLDIQGLVTHTLLSGSKSLYLRLAVPPELIASVLRNHHGLPVVGHPG